MLLKTARLKLQSWPINDNNGHVLLFSLDD